MLQSDLIGRLGIPAEFYAGQVLMFDPDKKILKE